MNVLILRIAKEEERGQLVWELLLQVVRTISPSLGSRVLLRSEMRGCGNLGSLVAKGLTNVGASPHQ